MISWQKKLKKALGMAIMIEPINPELAETKLRERFEKKVLDYKETYATWQRVKE